MQAGHHTRQKNDPGRVDAPAIEPFQALDDGFAQLFRGGGVAENAMLDPLLKSLKDARWSAKVAVGDPQRNDVAPGIAVPAHAPRPRALDRSIEIELHLPVIAKKKTILDLTYPRPPHRLELRSAWERGVLVVSVGHRPALPPRLCVCYRT